LNAGRLADRSTEKIALERPARGIPDDHLRADAFMTVILSNVKRAEHSQGILTLATSDCGPLARIKVALYKLIGRRTHGSDRQLTLRCRCHRRDRNPRRAPSHWGTPCHRGALGTWRRVRRERHRFAGR
jgi:hypothetical protein